MSLEQLIGKYFRLQQDLSMAYIEIPFLDARVERLATALSDTDREIAAMGPIDEQCSEMAFWFSKSSPNSLPVAT